MFSLCDKPTSISGSDCAIRKRCGSRYHHNRASFHNIKDVQCADCRKLLKKMERTNEEDRVEKLKNFYRPATLQAGGTTLAVCSGTPMIAMNPVTTTSCPDEKKNQTKRAQTSSYTRLKVPFDAVLAERDDLAKRLNAHMDVNDMLMHEIYDHRQTIQNLKTELA